MLTWFIIREFTINTNSAVIGFDLSFGSWYNPIGSGFMYFLAVRITRCSLTAYLTEFFQAVTQKRLEQVLLIAGGKSLSKS